MPMTRVIAALIAAVVCGSALARAKPPLPSGRFRVGGTNIMCVKEPCPRIGIMKLDPADGRPGWPIYSGRTPPRIEGDAAARAEVERRWTTGGCLIVEGAFLKPAVFEVKRVVEDCGPRRLRPAA